MAHLPGTAYRKAINLLFYRYLDLLDHLQHYFLVGRKTGLRICPSISCFITNPLPQLSLLDCYFVRFSLHWHLVVALAILDFTKMVVKMSMKMELVVDSVSVELHWVLFTIVVAAV